MVVAVKLDSCHFDFSRIGNKCNQYWNALEQAGKNLPRLQEGELRKPATKNTFTVSPKTYVFLFHTQKLIGRRTKLCSQLTHLFSKTQNLNGWKHHCQRIFFDDNEKKLTFYVWNFPQWWNILPNPEPHFAKQRSILLVTYSEGLNKSTVQKFLAFVS